MSSQAQIEIGSDFLGYRIEELIGRGGMGVVYRAYDLRLKRTVALKLVTPELALDERFRERFERETELAMALEHPNVVPIHDAGDVDGRLYLAMRLVEGPDLRDLLRSEGALAPDRALAICGQVGNALDAAHAKGLVHRDVKPSNVLLDTSEHVYLADFGLTRRLEESSELGDVRSLGTPLYLAPEQFEGRPVGCRADVYALGCLLYECLTGDVPFVRDSHLAVIWAHLEEEPPSASARNSDLPDAIDPVIRRALAKEPEARYPTSAALIAAAGEALGLSRRPVFRRHPLVLVAAAVVLAVLAAAFVVAFVTHDGGGRAAIGPIPVDSLVRVDPETNAIDRVVHVGSKPMAVVVAGDRVWVYNDADRTVSEIDAAKSELRHATPISAPPVDLGLLTGPVLAADAGGAWLVGVDAERRSFVTRIPAGGGGAHRFRVDHEPRAVAVGEGAIWVIGRSVDDDQLLRIDPSTGEVTGRVRFPPATRVDSLDVGLGSVWVVSSSTATLYRIEPRSAIVNGRFDLGTHAGRPAARFGAVWVGVSDGGGVTVLVEPRSLHVVRSLDCCPLGDGYDAVGGFGATWTTDWSTGTVVRWNSQTYQIDATIHVAEPPFFGGRCLTAIAAGARAVWATVGPSLDYRCDR